ncbi:MAG TPA: hypothetical protein VLX32_07410 [Candidatus Acidoferrum sp.]|nr:hypothetical protein [Candidatus Acidoferrum sp.]
MIQISLPMALIWTGIACAVLVGLALSVRAYALYRGRMLVKCPETGESAAVHVDTLQAVKNTLLGRASLQLDQCSRWPERADCGQDCLGQIEADPKSCLVWTAVTDWYHDKECAYCKRPFHEVHWHDRPPALLSPDHKTAQWNEIAPEKLPEVFESYLPICWSCHMAERFRSEHPDLVIDRPGNRGPMNEYLEHEPTETAKSHRPV